MFRSSRRHVQTVPACCLPRALPSPKVPRARSRESTRIGRTAPQLVRVLAMASSWIVRGLDKTTFVAEAMGILTCELVCANQPTTECQCRMCLTNHRRTNGIGAPCLLEELC